MSYYPILLWPGYQIYKYKQCHTEFIYRFKKKVAVGHKVTQRNNWWCNSLQRFKCQLQQLFLYRSSALMSNVESCRVSWNSRRRKSQSFLRSALLSRKLLGSNVGCCFMFFFWRFGGSNLVRIHRLSCKIKWIFGALKGDVCFVESHEVPWGKCPSQTMTRSMLVWELHLPKWWGDKYFGGFWESQNSSKSQPDHLKITDPSKLLINI